MGTSDGKFSSSINLVQQLVLLNVIHTFVIVEFLIISSIHIMLVRMP